MVHLEHLRNLNSGLLDIPFAHWSKSALVDWAGASSRWGQSTALNSLYYATLLDAADLAKSVGAIDEAAYWNNTAAEVKVAINQYLYLPQEKNIYTPQGIK